MNQENRLIFTSFNLADDRIGHHADPARSLKNKYLRCAIRKAYDWEERRKLLYAEMGVLYPGVIPPSFPGYNPGQSKESIHPDINQAKALLQKGEWNSQSLPALNYSNVSNSQSHQFSILFKKWMTSIGYNSAKIKFNFFSDKVAYTQAMRKGKVLLHERVWTLNNNNTSEIFSLFYGPNKSPGINTTNYQNPEFDKLYEQTLEEESEVKRIELYKKMNQMIIDDCVIMGSFSRMAVAFWHKNVHLYPDTGPLRGAFKYVGIVEEK